MNDKEQITSLKNFNVDNIMFAKPSLFSVPLENNNNSKIKAEISYRRINIKTRYNNKTFGNLIVLTEKDLFSFGVQQNVYNERNYNMGICLWNKENPTDSQKEWTDTFTKIVEKCKEHIQDPEIRDEIEQESPDLSDFDPLKWKREKGKDGKTKKNGKIIEGTGPIISPKVILTGQRKSIFDDIYGREIEDPMTIGKCIVRAAIRIESIYIGSKIIALQIKLQHAVVKSLDQPLRRLVPIQLPEDEDQPEEDITDLISSTSENPLVENTSFADLSIVDSDNEEKTEKPKQRQKITRRK